ncbi:unnamed protein product [Prorocentrum cordatum]|uniref:Peptide-O-fucosyltransferase 1 n=1 Tax=Prorocentrum cordatum TaxID=2364126 RepID=A0ABN9VHN0_9DINO|nr:unnamed protein product [Polarella glacialis]
MRPVLALAALVAAGALAPKKAPQLRDGGPGGRDGCAGGGCEDAEAELHAEVASGFQSRPERSSWEGRLRQVVDGARPQKPCNADVVARSYARVAGFGSRMNSFADELLVGFYRGRSFALCNGSRDTFVRAVWATHFRNVARFPTCNTGRAVCRHDNAWSPRLSQGLARADRAYLDDLKHFLYPYLFTLTRGAQDYERVDQRLLSAGVPLGEPYLAVHVRRGDKLVNEARRVEAGTYAEAALWASGFLALHSSSSRRDLLLRELRAANASAVYVSSDDGRAAAELGAELGGGVRIVQQPRGSGQGYDSRGYEGGG